MKSFLTLLYIFLLPFALSAQAVVKGRVTGQDGTPLVAANVMVKNGQGKLVAFGSTTADGSFAVKVAQPDEQMTLNVTMIGFKPYTTTLPTDGKSVEICMEEGMQQLQEVIVRGERIRESGDTVTYNVISFAQKQDRSIGDVLQRMPGIDVAKNGKIQYQGVDINKFYIEGSDLLGGKYGIATGGISHEDIGAVEVLENHQPMQVLRGLSFSDQAAINLRMKDKSKATLLAHGSLGGGWSNQPEGALWQGDFFTMVLKGRYQMITTLKGNNTGQNLSDQLIDFISERSDEQLESYISVALPSTPNLQQRRSYFNRSWMLSSSHLWKTRTGDEVKAQVDYHNDRLIAQGESTTTYFLESGERVIVEDRHSLTHRNALTGTFSYEANKRDYYLSNTLATDLSWNDLTLATLGTLPNTQEARLPEYAVSNRLKLIKRFKNNRLVTFTSQNEWNSLPERLTVGSDDSDYGQRINQHSFYTDERASLGFVFGRLLLSLEAGAAGYFRHLDTRLWGIDDSDLQGEEALTTDYLRLFAAPRLEWSRKRVELNLNVPVNFYTYFFSGGLSDRTEWFVSPSVTFRWKPTPQMAFTLRGNAHRSPASLHDIHGASILTDYRSFGSGVDDYYTSSGQSLSASYTYRNAPCGIFVMALGSYGWGKSKFGTVQDIAGDYIFHSYRRQPSDSRNAMSMLNLSKTLDFVRGAVGLRGSYSRRENNLLSQGVPTDYTASSLTLSPFVNGSLASILNWSFRFTWERSMLDISEQTDRSSNNFLYSCSLTLTPCPLVTWTAGGEYYRNQVETGGYKDMMMLDTRLAFNLGKRLEISASVTNLLNRKAYSYTTYGTVAQYHRSSRLRGREFLLSLYFSPRRTIR